MVNVLTPEVLDVVLSIMEGLDCPRSLSVAILVRHCEWDQVTSFEADPTHYLEPRDYFGAVAATDLLRKYDGFTLSVDPEAAAIEKWWWAERQCYRTNERLSPLVYGGSYGSDIDGALLDFVSRMRKAAEFLIGDRPPNTFDGKFGPGATMSDMSRFTTVPDKMSSLPTLTPNALFHLVPWTGTQWAEACAALGNSPLVVRGNSFFSVPKTSRTRRGCAKEPSLNGFYQLGLGREIRKRLGRRGFDLVNGQGVHRRVACSASNSGDFATIDLSSASDTVCTNLVKLVLPHRWHSMLDSLRSPFTKMGKSWVKLEKFSSMGNGFTFELETTLFACICMAVMGDDARPGRNLFVYGDDIIVPSKFSKDVIAALKFFGFTPNLKKTFTEGVFRESCGGDFFAGISVRAHYLTKDPDEPQHVISLANGIRRLAFQDSYHDDRWPGLRRAWFKCLDLLPSTIRRCRGPQALGDLVVHDDEERWETRWRSSGIRYVRVYRPANYRVVRWDGFAHSVQFATAIYLAGSGPDTYRRVRPRYSLQEDDPRGLLPRDAVTGFKVGWVPFS
jgi:hypothetical protein